MYTAPWRSTASPSGDANRASCAGPPSPENPATPTPAKDEIEGGCAAPATEPPTSAVASTTTASLADIGPLQVRPSVPARDPSRATAAPSMAPAPGGSAGRRGVGSRRPSANERGHGCGEAVAVQGS